ncbi:MAG: CHAT domain-containing protein [Acidimicrobiales bacterium]
MRGEETNSLLDRATVGFRLATSDPSRGRREAESVAEQAAQSDAPDAAEAEVVALRGASWAARELFDHEAARRLIDRAVTVARSNGLTARQSECLLTRSSVHLEHGRHADARADLEEAAALAPAEIGAEVAVSLGVIEQKAGAYVAALDAYERALGLAIPQQVDVRFKALSNGALCASRLSRHQQAQVMIDEAVVVAADASDVYVAHAAHNRAVLAAERGDPATALADFDRALELWDAANLLRAEHYLEKAETFLALRLLAEADAAVTAALHDLAGRPGAALLLAEGLLLAAVIADNRGDGERSIELNERAAATFAEQDRTGWWAIAEHAAVTTRLAGGLATVDDHAQLGLVEQALAGSGHANARAAAALTAARLARDLGKRAEAEASYRRCAAIGRKGSALQRIQGWVAQAELADMKRDGRRASSAARAGLRTLDDYRSAFDAVELRARAANYGEGLAMIGLRWADRSRRPQRVWSWLERTRAAALVDSPPSADDDETEVALARLRATTAQLAELGADGTGIVEAQRDLARAEHALRALSWKRTRDHDGRSRDGSEPTLGRSPTAATLKRIQSDLGSTGLVQYGVVDGAVIAVVVTSERRALVRLGQADDQAAAARDVAFALRRLGRSRTPASSDASVTAVDAALDRLDGCLTSPHLGRLLDRCSEVVVVPPSAMMSTPWANLSTYADRPTSVAPSATAWWVTARRRPAADSRLIALAGPRLVHAADEVRSVAAVHSDGQAVVGPDSTSTVLTDSAATVGTVHIAAHGRLRQDSPTFSSFELADGPFTVHDMRRLPSPIRRWVLASCDLGSSGSSGADLEGIVAALFSAGAGAIVAASVEVPDTSTTKLMVGLHRRLAEGVSMPVALHGARQGLDPTNPGERIVQLAFTCFGAA